MSSEKNTSELSDLELELVAGGKDNFQSRTWANVDNHNRRSAANNDSLRRVVTPRAGGYSGGTRGTRVL